MPGPAASELPVFAARRAGEGDALLGHPVTPAGPTAGGRRRALAVLGAVGLCAMLAFVGAGTQAVLGPAPAVHVATAAQRRWGPKHIGAVETQLNQVKRLSELVQERERLSDNLKAARSHKSNEVALAGAQKQDFGADLDFGADMTTDGSSATTLISGEAIINTPMHAVGTEKTVGAAAAGMYMPLVTAPTIWAPEGTPLTPEEISAGIGVSTPIDVATAQAQLRGEQISFEEPAEQAGFQGQGGGGGGGKEPVDMESPPAADAPHVSAVGDEDAAFAPAAPSSMLTAAAAADGEAPMSELDSSIDSLESGAVGMLPDLEATQPTEVAGAVPETDAYMAPVPEASGAPIETAAGADALAPWAPTSGMAVEDIMRLMDSSEAAVQAKLVEFQATPRGTSISNGLAHEIELMKANIKAMNLEKNRMKLIAKGGSDASVASGFAPASSVPASPAEAISAPPQPAALPEPAAAFPVPAAPIAAAAPIEYAAAPIEHTDSPAMHTDIPGGLRSLPPSQWSLAAVPMEAAPAPYPGTVMGAAMEAAPAPLPAAAAYPPPIPTSPAADLYAAAPYPPPYPPAAPAAAAAVPIQHWHSAYPMETEPQIVEQQKVGRSEYFINAVDVATAPQGFMMDLQADGKERTQPDYTGGYVGVDMGDDALPAQDAGYKAAVSGDADVVPTDGANEQSGGSSEVEAGDPVEESRERGQQMDDMLNVAKTPDYVSSDAAPQAPGGAALTVADFDQRVVEEHQLIAAKVRPQGKAGFVVLSNRTFLL